MNRDIGAVVSFDRVGRSQSLLRSRLPRQQGREPDSLFPQFAVHVAADEHRSGEDQGVGDVVLDASRGAAPTGAETTRISTARTRARSRTTTETISRGGRGTTLAVFARVHPPRGEALVRVPPDRGELPRSREPDEGPREEHPQYRAPLGLFGSGASLTLEGRNLTDNRISDVNGFPLPGRSYFVTLGYRN